MVLFNCKLLSGAQNVLRYWIQTKQNVRLALNYMEMELFINLTLINVCVILTKSMRVHLLIYKVNVIYALKLLVQMDLSAKLVQKNMDKELKMNSVVGVTINKTMSVFLLIQQIRVHCVLNSLLMINLNAKSAVTYTNQELFFKMENVNVTKLIYMLVYSLNLQADAKNVLKQLTVLSVKLAKQCMAWELFLIKFVFAIGKTIMQVQFKVQIVVSYALNL
ncbi:Hypothetical_protein [Hexamita inflata]|uniref:Hypothetical_protein n=1 Tax=Hexamita inflata TaxID=28002 RepID=A0ABP1HT35_9EUKA